MITRASSASNSRMADDRIASCPSRIEIQRLGYRKLHTKVSSIRVMVVEDFLSFRKYVCAKLDERPELQVICEVSDGLEAVHKASSLQPDLILLDVGLPTLNGIEVARRLRELAPKSKVIFLSQEMSADFVHQSVNLDACGYVFKMHAEVDLLLAIDAVLSGKRFVSSA